MHSRGRGSVGRAQPCQGWGRGFEPRRPLHFFIGRHGQVVRQRPAKPLSPVRIRMSPPFLNQEVKVSNTPSTISQKFIYFFGAFGGILFGYDIGVMTGALPFLKID